MIGSVFPRLDPGFYRVHKNIIIFFGLDLKLYLDPFFSDSFQYLVKNVPDPNKKIKAIIGGECNRAETSQMMTTTLTKTKTKKTATTTKADLRRPR